MAIKKLKATLRLINRVLADPRVGSGHRDRLQKARRELAKLARQGKLNRQKILFSVEIVVKVLLEIVKEDATRRHE